MAAPVSTALLALGEPHPQAKAMAGVGDRRQQVGVFLAPAQEVVGSDEMVGRAGQAAIALETGATSVSSGRSWPVNRVAMRS